MTRRDRRPDPDDARYDVLNRVGNVAQEMWGQDVMVSVNHVAFVSYARVHSAGVVVTVPAREIVTARPHVPGAQSELAFLSAAVARTAQASRELALVLDRMAEADKLDVRKFVRRWLSEGAPAPGEPRR